MLQTINNLKEGNFDEIPLNAGQGIMFDKEDDQLYLVNFFDEEHTTIKSTKAIGSDVAYHLACTWLGTASTVA